MPHNEIITGAIEVIRKDGWAKGVMHRKGLPLSAATWPKKDPRRKDPKYTPGYCMLGAIYQAAGLKPTELWVNVPPVVRRAINLVGRTVEPKKYRKDGRSMEQYTSNGIITHWNDQEKRTKREVLTKLRVAARRAVKEHEQEETVT